MDHFQIHAPTQIIFGKNTENEAGKWCKYYGAHKVLVHFGGHSAKKSGLLDRVCASLQDAGLEYVLLGGVVPNPQLSMVKKGVELAAAVLSTVPRALATAWLTQEMCGIIMLRKKRLPPALRSAQC